ARRRPARKNRVGRWPRTPAAHPDWEFRFSCPKNAATPVAVLKIWQDIVQFYQLLCAARAHILEAMNHATPTTPTARMGGHILVDQLAAHGVRHVFCVPGESYLAVLDGLHDHQIEVTVCRQEGGAAMMADAHGKLTGAPGICMVTRGPGAANAMAGVHIASQDSTPMILFVGQIER